MLDFVPVDKDPTNFARSWHKANLVFQSVRSNPRILLAGFELRH